MTKQVASRDPNRVPTMVGVDSTSFEDSTTVAVDPTTHELLTQTNETAPTDATKVNPSLTVSYNAAGDVVKLEKTIGGTTYTKTFTRSDNVVASTLPISVWS